MSNKYIQTTEQENPDNLPDTVDAGGKILSRNPNNDGWEFIEQGFSISYSPANFTPTNGTIDGYFEGVDDALVGGTGIGPNTLTITSTTQTTQTTGWQVLSAFEFDPTEYDGYSTIEFRALIETTNASDDAEIRLFNLDTATVVGGSTISTTSTSTTLVSVDITNEIDTSSSIYEVQLRLAVTGSPNSAICKRAEIRVT